MADEKPVGIITHYFDHINVAVVKLNGTLKEGDKIRIKGVVTDFEETVKSMQIDHSKVREAKKGQEIGMKVLERVREHDKVFKVA